MTTRVPIRYGGTGANTASDARTALGVPPLAAYDVANSASSTANAAYSQANTAYSAANTANTNALNAYSQANSAYGQANTAYGQANDAYAAANTANTNALNAYAQANAAYSQANAAYNAANNAQVTVYANNASNVTTQRINFVNTATVTVSVTADSSNANIAFTAAPQTVVNDTYTAAGNTAAAATANIANGLYAISTSAYDQANTARGQANTAYGQANDAYAAANTANTNALNAYSQANAAYGQANTAYGQANDAYAQANTARGTANSAYGQANNAYAQANDAYAAANTANTNALAAYGQANLAYTQANAAYNQANAAYAEANLKLNLTGGTINGSLNVSGNLTITGNTSYINVSTLNVSDPIIFIAANNDTSDIVDIGFVGGKNTGGSFTHTGLVRDAGDGTWYLFDNLTDAGHVNNVIDFANTTLALLRANINANSILLTGNAVATQANLTLAHNQANTANAQANLAYDQANAARSDANTTFGTINTNITTANTQANAARDQANSAYGAANSAANTVRVSQNGTSTLSAKQLNFVNTANVKIAVSDSGDGNANITFDLGAGGGGTLSNIAISSNGVFRTNANAFNFVNTSTVSVTVSSGVNGNANISFTSAATGNTAIARQSFTGNGAQTIYSLSTAPEDENHTLVFVDAVFQGPDAYSINGTNLEFTSAPDNGANVEVYIYGSGSAGQVVITSDRFAGTGSCTAFTLSQTGSAIKTLVFLDGVAQRPLVDYQVSGTGLSFNVAPASATVIEARTFSNFNATDINVAPVSLTSDRFTGTGSCTAFTLSQTGTTDSTFVFLNGVSQKPGVDYSVANTQLTLTSAPANGTIVEARTIGSFKVIETSSKIDSDTFNADGNTTVYSLSASSTTTKVFVNIDGVSQKPYTDYIVSGNKLTFVQAPPSGTVIEARSFSPFVIAQETLKSLNIYARTGAVTIALTGAGTFAVVGRSANTIIGVS